MNRPDTNAAESQAETSAHDPPGFDWPLCYDAENFLRERIDGFLARNPFARRLSDRMRDESGTDFFEWIDHLVLSPQDEGRLAELGFVRDDVDAPNGETALHHPRAILPRVLLRAGDGRNPAVIALRPESVVDFVARMSVAAEIEGEPFSRHRRAVVAEANGTRLEAVERHACRGYVSAPLQHDERKAILRAKELWATRRRGSFANDAEGFAVANRILDESVSLIGRDLSCELFFEAERACWELRNHAARVQKHRQDRLGLGWGNHDHHTFRSSREHFVDLIAFLLRLGFEKRERYYAGAEAGWGAQILEQPVAGIVVFADVDLMPEETQIDFSRRRLPAASKLGTVGLWCALHGESFLDAGMHHLEARFDYQRLRDQLKEEGVNTMNPFSDFEFLKQAFTEGERWPVRRERAERLLDKGLISREQFDKFTTEGAIGSHLENLQRRGGFKGFNQKAVSVIISATDPRKQTFKQPAAAA